MNDHGYRSNREFAGAKFVETKLPKACKKCASQVFLGLIRTEKNSTLKWMTFDRAPTERAGQRLYTKHVCAPR